jgi:AhpD family alkylhydroperoxidase
MAGNIGDDLRALQQRIGNLAQALPGTMGGVKRVADEAAKPGRLSPGLKELVAATLSVTKGCEDCILYHIAAAKRHGASREELVELLAVAVEMGGGPAVVYAGKALAAFDQLG